MAFKTRIAALQTALGPFFGSAVRDGLGVAGAGLTAYGAGLVYRPAGFIVLGALLLAAAWLLARAEG